MAVYHQSICLSLCFMPIPPCLMKLYSFDMQQCKSSSFVLQNNLDYSKSFAFPYTLQRQLVNFHKNPGILTETTWIPQTKSQTRYSITVSLQIHEHKYLSIWYLGLLYFLTVIFCSFQCRRLVLSFTRFISKSVTYFGSIIHGTLIFFFYLPLVFCYSVGTSDICTTTFI